MSDVPRQRTLPPIPLHAFRPNGDTEQCSYVSRGLMCGANRNSKLHHVDAVPTQRKPEYVPTAAIVESFFEGVTKLVAEKDRYYGAAWRRQGYMGNLSRILSKADRLRAMGWQDEQGALLSIDADEAACDTVRDLAALCAMFEANLLSGNRWGENA